MSVGVVAETEEKSVSVPSQASQDAVERDVEQHFDIEAVEAVDRVADMLGAAEGNQNSAAARVVNHHPLEALLGAGNFPQLLDVPPDADDEAMVELAIALSLQDHEGGHADLQALRQGFQQSFPNLQGIQSLQNLSGSTLQSLQNLAAQGLVQVPNAAQVTRSSVIVTRLYYSDFVRYSIFNNIINLQKFISRIRAKKRAIIPTRPLLRAVPMMRDQPPPLMVVLFERLPPNK